jgi:hypothetical protein
MLAWVVFALWAVGVIPIYSLAVLAAILIWFAVVIVAMRRLVGAIRPKIDLAWKSDSFK